MRDFKHKVQRAAARLRWTGSWYEVLVAVDPLGREEAEEALLCEIAAISIATGAWGTTLW